MVCNSMKYNAWHHPDKKTVLFVGVNGALRSGDCASKSHSVGDPARHEGFYGRLLASGDAEIAKAKTIDLDRL